MPAAAPTAVDPATVDDWRSDLVASVLNVRSPAECGTRRITAWYDQPTTAEAVAGS